MRTCQLGYGCCVGLLVLVGCTPSNVSGVGGAAADNGVTETSAGAGAGTDTAVAVAADAAAETGTGSPAVSPVTAPAPAKTAGAPTLETGVATVPAAVPAITARYEGTGFVVHEWGTNTQVIGSDGSLQRGLHHEGDDLPSFVYDRLKQGETLRFPSVDKMETPVDYFYSDKARTVSVRLDMPLGVPTQWYPAVREFGPPVLQPSSGVLLVDPVTDTHMALSSQQCIDKYTSFSSGSLNWGEVKILAPGEASQKAAPDAPLDQFTWSYARQVAANMVQVDTSTDDASGSTITASQAERFLFYRGLGNYEAPLRVTAASAEPAGHERLTLHKATTWHSTAPAFVMRVTGESGAFVRVDQPDSAAIDADVPDESALQPIDAFLTQLTSEMTRALQSTGLYDDEAAAMVNTWRTQWFATPGVRVLYIAPSSWLDDNVRLTITPAPDQVTRVMVMRVEVITPALEARDVAAVRTLENAPNAEGRAYFQALGRFAEPRLRRALTLTGGAAGPQTQAFLSELESPAFSSALGE